MYSSYRGIVKWVSLVQSHKKVGDMARLRVKEVAQQKGFSRGKLSRAADIDTNTLKRVYDDPNYSPTLITLEKLAKALGVKIADLIEED